MQVKSGSAQISPICNFLYRDIVVAMLLGSLLADFAGSIND